MNLFRYFCQNSQNQIIHDTQCIRMIRTSDSVRRNKQTLFSLDIFFLLKVSMLIC